MAIVRVFKSGNSQAVRLPKQFRVKSSEVEIFRRGDEIVLREKAGGMVRVLDLLAKVPADMFPKEAPGGNDLWIATHARSARLILVTNNERESKRVPGLKPQNWTSGRP